MVDRATRAEPVSLHLVALDRRIVIDCNDLELLALLRANFGCLETGPTSAREHALHISVLRDPAGVALHLFGRPELRPVDPSELLFLLEQHLTVELQRERRDLFFLHAAVLGTERGAILLAGESGAGKSTLTWALVQEGLPYLSDELAPISLADLTVHGYPHAICLKSPPPPPYRLPEATLVTEETLHVPASECPAGVASQAPLDAVVLVERFSPSRERPTLRPASPAEASARIVVHALNALAHGSSGLDAAQRIARSARCFVLEPASLGDTCALLLGHLEAAGAPAPALGT